MKRLFLTIIAIAAFAAGGFAQTAQEIVERMDQEINKGETLGTALTMTMKMPIIGEISTRISTLGDKSKAEMEGKGEKSTVWYDKDVSWTFTPKDNEIVIKKVESEENQEKDLASGVTEGYKVSIAGETADTWILKCKKLRSNDDKGDPKRMDLIVSKKTYLPISLNAKASIIKITLSDYVIGVSPEEVAFDPSAFPGVKITDQR